VASEYDPSAAAEDVKAVLKEWLDAPTMPEMKPPVRGDAFLESFRQAVFAALDPAVTVLNRTKKRLRLRGSLNERFAPDFPGDPLDSIMWAPEFRQPMYEPLRDISHSLVLPGVEKIPQNTLGVLLTNRRFVESYMCGLNHELAGELLWREYPTDQRGSYFRQFWDVTGHVLTDRESSELLALWRQKQGIGRTTSMAELDLDLRKSFVQRDLKTAGAALTDALFARHGVVTLAELSVPEQALVARFLDEDVTAVDGIPDETVLNRLVEAVGIKEQLDEKLRDITPLTTWRHLPLGANKPRVDPAPTTESLVLVIRGDLLKRYPNSSVYAVDGVVTPSGRRLPKLAEYFDFTIDAARATALQSLGGFTTGAVSSPLLAEFERNDLPIPSSATVAAVDGNTLVVRLLDGAAFEIRKRADNAHDVRYVATPPVFPIFRATLPPDLTFFGFPFDAAGARAADESQPGKYFVIEEPIAEPRFGLDVPSDAGLAAWTDLSWSHFGLAEDFGTYLDDYSRADVTDDDLVPSETDGTDSWAAATSSARRARICFQKPARVIVHANQMLPADERRQP
jgi:hypothetical protein